MELYGYQLEGAEWLAARERAGLFDDMGLGKTPQAIHAAQLCGAENILVLSPSVVAWNWRAEWRTWANRDAFVIDKSKVAVESRNHNIVCTTHGLLLRSAVRTELLRREWDLLIVDEIDEYRGRDSKRAEMLYGIGHWNDTNPFPSMVSRARRVWGLTGTPMPNNPSELWTFLAGLFPERIAKKGKSTPVGYWTFAKRYCQTYRGRFGWVVKGKRNIPELRQRCRGVWLRRLKKDELDLPPIRTVSLEVRPKALPRELTALARDLDLSTDTEPAAALRALQASGEAPGNFRRLIGEAKIEPTVEIVDHDLDHAAGPLVVMAWHRSVVAGVAEGLRKLRWRVATITGNSSARVKHDISQRFQAGELDVVVGQIKAAGSGVTLTRASELVFVELDYVPGLNAQARDRIYRISQTSPCRVRVLGLSGTVDTVIQKTLREKTAAIRSVFEDEE